MKTDKRLLLEEELENLAKSASYVAYSLARCQALGDRSEWNLEELERLESLTSRFARLSDLLTHRLLRLIDDLELTPEGSLLDRFQRAEKRGLSSARDLVRIRELRNLIAHEYASDRMAEIYQAAMGLAPKLNDLASRIIVYGKALLARYPA